MPNVSSPLPGDIAGLFQCRTSRQRAVFPLITPSTFRMSSQCSVVGVGWLLYKFARGKDMPYIVTCSTGFRKVISSLPHTQHTCARGTLTQCLKSISIALCNINKNFNSFYNDPYRYVQASAGMRYSKPNKFSLQWCNFFVLREQLTWLVSDPNPEPWLVLVLTMTLCTQWSGPTKGSIWNNLFL